MAGFEAFLGSLVSQKAQNIGSKIPLIASLFAHGFKGVKSAVQSLADATTGAHLTGAQREANAFTAEQAQQQMAFQQQMRDTQYQSAVDDMKSAGVNPALMYGSGASGNVAPTGAMGSSVSPSSDPVGLLGQLMNLKLLSNQARLLDSQADKNYQDIEESKNRVVNIQAQTQSIFKNMDLMDVNIRKVGLDADAQKIANKYLDREKQMALDVQELTKQEIAQNVENAKKAYDLLDAQTKSEIQNLANMQAEYNVLLSQKELTDEQKAQVRALTGQIYTQTQGILTDNKIKEKDLEWYTWNQIGSSVGSVAKSVGKLIAKIPFKKVPRIGFKH